MNYQPSPVILSTLSRNEPAHIYIAEFLLMDAIHRQISFEPGMYDLEDVLYLHLVQTSKDRWIFNFSVKIEEGIPEEKYRVVTGLTIPEILSLCKNTVERQTFLKTLLPIGVKTTVYHDLIKEIRKEFN